MQKILTLNNAKHYGIESARMQIGRFSGGEVSLVIKENLKDADVIIVGSTNAPAENLIELFLTIDNAYRLGAKKVTAVVPYFAYARADREKFSGNAISAQTLAKMLISVAGPNFEIISFDIHSPKVQSYFSIPFKSIDTSDLFIEKFTGAHDFFLVAPDKGAEIKTFEFGQKLGIKNISVLHKERTEDGKILINGITGTVGAKVLMVDDIIDSGETILKGTEFLRDHGVREVSVVSTHMVWQGGGYQNLAESDLVKKIYTTDTIAPPTNIPGKVEIVSIIPVLRKIINDSQLIFS